MHLQRRRRQGKLLTDDIKVTNYVSIKLLKINVLRRKGKHLIDEDFNIKVTIYVSIKLLKILFTITSIYAFNSCYGVFLTK